MTADRITEIKTSLAFARNSLDDLLDLTVKAQINDHSVEFIGHKTGAILQAVRQCFDYCAADFRDDFIKKPKLNVYYPFHPNALGKGKPLYALKGSNPKAYSALIYIANRIHSKDTIPNTTCHYGDLTCVNRLVNCNKHDRVHRVSERQDARTLIQGDGGQVISISPVYPVKSDGTVDYSNPGPVGPKAWTAPANANVSAVKDFEFEDGSGLSRKDVHGFCMMVITATKFVLGYVYAEAYGLPEAQFRE